MTAEQAQFLLPYPAEEDFAVDTTKRVAAVINVTVRGHRL